MQSLRSIIVLLIGLTFFVPLSWSGNMLQSVKVPGARCQDGSSYRFYLKKGNPRKIVFHLQGGGACWNKFSCTGWIPFSQRSVARAYSGGVFSDTLIDNPLSNYTFIQVPYCTGDIFTGTHTAHYSKRKVYHHGRDNLHKVLKSLEKEGIHLESAQEVVVHGSSAGALGVLLNFDLWKNAFSPLAHKTLIADAPGLHFGKNLWKRFSSRYMDDIFSALQRIGADFPDKQKTQVSIVEELCRQNRDWTFGVLHGQRDAVMSFFGRMSRLKHRRLSRSQKGVHEKLKKEGDNCVSWMPDTKAHTFLESDEKIQIKTSEGISALDFLKQILRGEEDRQSSYL